MPFYRMTIEGKPSDVKLKYRAFHLYTSATEMIVAAQTVKRARMIAANKHGAWWQDANLTTCGVLDARPLRVIMTNEQ